MSLEEQAQLLANNLIGWENSTLQRIGKRIGRYGKMSLADVKSINNIAVVKQDMEAITKELAKVTGYNISQIEQMYGELLEEQHLANQPLYDYRGKTFVPFAENRELQAIARAYAKNTGETMINLAKTKALCVLGANGKPIGMQKYYTDVLDKAVMQVTTGATDFHTAMRDSIIELGGSGVRVDYGGGITRRLDTVVRQNLLWGAKQASTEYNTMIGEELGCDGIEVDFHSNPRPSHEFMQGKQYVLGKARTINGIHFESADEAIERLQDYGCLHYKTPIICGVSEPRYSPEELKRLNEQNAKRYTIDGKEYSGYEVTQMQRRLESSVRNEKTTRDLAKASGDNALVKRCNERIKAYQGKYDEISEITGIQGDKKRMSVPRGTATVKSATPTKVEPPKPTFKKAENIEEAQQYAERFVESYKTKYSGNVDYSGIQLDYANEMNRAFTEVFDAYDTKYPLRNIQPFNTREKRFKGTTAEAAYQWGLNDMFYNKAYYRTPKAFAEHLAEYNGLLDTVLPNIDTAISRTTNPTSLKYLEALKRTGRTNVFAPDAYGSTIHEMGHYLDDQLFRTAFKERGFDLSASFQKYSGGISGYATATPQEYIAESFAAYWKGEIDILDPDLVKIFGGLRK